MMVLIFYGLSILGAILVTYLVDLLPVKREFHVHRLSLLIFEDLYHFWQKYQEEEDRERRTFWLTLWILGFLSQALSREEFVKMFLSFADQKPDPSLMRRCQEWLKKDPKARAFVRRLDFLIWLYAPRSTLKLALKVHSFRVGGALSFLKFPPNTLLLRVSGLDICPA